MRKWFRQFILGFIPGEAFRDDDELSRNKFFVGTSFITVLFAAAYFVMNIFIEYYFGLVLMAAAIVFFSIAPLLLKRNMKLELLSNSSIGAIAIIYILLAFTSGGAMNGPMDHWLMMLPMLGLLLLNYKQAVSWLLVSILIAVVFIFMEKTGVKMPTGYPEQYDFLFSVLSFIGLIVLLFAMTNVFKAGKNEALRNLDHKNKALSAALKTLRETQAQLVQHEKLAALGQMTAGIAHEIQNPVNFINNFSILSSDLLKELRNADSDEKKNSIIENLLINLSKIKEHGMRADFIIKSMIDHNQAGTGEKQLTDINWLGEEFLNLSYHVMRNRLSGLSCIFAKELGSGIPRINIVSQEISHMFLNLFNNAFYAVHQKMEKQKSVSARGGDFQPTVLLKTELVHKLNSAYVSISIRDNGVGVPDAIKDKIFEPFFTTKTGEGTGLGLSLSYDIVAAHGGEISMQSKENEFTEFVITLPV